MHEIPFNFQQWWVRHRSGHQGVLLILHRGDQGLHLLDHVVKLLQVTMSSNLGGGGGGV